jgi:hypothetical protein
MWNIWYASTVRNIIRWLYEAKPGRPIIFNKVIKSVGCDWFFSKESKHLLCTYRPTGMLNIEITSSSAVVSLSLLQIQWITQWSRGGASNLAEQNILPAGLINYFGIFFSTSELMHFQFRNSWNGTLDWHTCKLQCLWGTI